MRNCFAVLFFCVFSLFSQASALTSISSSGRGTLLVLTQKGAWYPSDYTGYNMILYDLATGATDTLVKETATTRPFGCCFSPDGKKVAYYLFTKNASGKDIAIGKISIFDLFTRQITTVGPELDGNAMIGGWVGGVNLVWRDSCIYTCFKLGLSLHKLNIYTGRIDTVFTFSGGEAPDHWLFYANVSEDGRHGSCGVFLGGDCDKTFDLDSNKEYASPRGGQECQPGLSPDGHLAISSNHGSWLLYQSNKPSNLIRTLSGLDNFGNRWSYNSNNDVTWLDGCSNKSYRYFIDANHSEYIFSGGIPYDFDTRGWVLDTLAPGTPVNLRADAFERGIRLIWNAPAPGQSPATGYYIERDGKKLAEVKDTFYVDTVLKANTSYSYSVFSQCHGVALSAPATSVFTTTVDRTPPRPVAAYSYGNAIDVVFSEPVLSSSACVISNYTMDPAITAASAVLQKGVRVHFTTNAFGHVSHPWIRVSNVRDSAQTPNTLSLDSVPLISIRDVVIDASYSPAWGFIDSGGRMFADGTTRILANPKNLAGLPYLTFKTAAGSVSDTSELIGFTLNRPTEVLIAVRMPISAPYQTVYGGPSWLAFEGIEGEGWKQTGEYIDEYKIYSKIFTSGSVSLKGYGSTAWWNNGSYFVLFRKTDAADIIDNAKPTVVQAVSVHASGVKVVFSEPIDSVSAKNISNYGMNGSVSVLSAKMSSRRAILLTTSPLSYGSSYSLTVSGVKDLANPQNTMDAATVSLTFDWVFGFINSGFEIPILNGSAINPPEAGWEFTGGSAGITEENVLHSPPAVEGKQAAFLSSGCSMSQTFSLVNPCVARVFFKAQKQIWQNVPKLAVSIDNVNVGTFSPNIGPFETARYLSYSTSILSLSAGDHVILFEETANNGGRVFIDSVILADTNALSAISSLPLADMRPALEAAPNPFNPCVRIVTSGLSQSAELKIYDVSGKMTEDLTVALNGAGRGAGNRSVMWNAAGRASGVYVIMLKDGKTELKRKVVFIR